MEMILINSEKLKVMLDSIDMENYHLSDDPPIDKSEGELIVSTVLKAAFDKCGFDAENASLFIQVFKSKDGGCEFFVTKKKAQKKHDSPAFCTESSSYVFNHASRPCEVLQMEENTSLLPPSFFGFGWCFEGLEEMLCFCKEAALSKEGEWELFRGEEGLYYLLSKYDSLHAGEFGGKRCSAAERLYIREHASLICKSAQNILPFLSV